MTEFVADKKRIQAKIQDCRAEQEASRSWQKAGEVSLVARIEKTTWADTWFRSEEVERGEKLSIKQIKSNEEKLKVGKDLLVEKELIKLELKKVFSEIIELKKEANLEGVARKYLEIIKEYGKEVFALLPQEIAKLADEEAKDSILYLDRQGLLTKEEKILFSTDKINEKYRKLILIHERSGEDLGLSDIVEQLESIKGTQIVKVEKAEEVFKTTVVGARDKKLDLKKYRVVELEFANEETGPKRILCNFDPLIRSRFVPDNAEIVLLKDVQNLESKTKSQGGVGAETSYQIKNPNKCVVTEEEIVFYSRKDNKFFDIDGKIVEEDKFPDRKVVDRQINSAKAFHLRAYENKNLIQTPIGLRMLVTSSGRNIEGIQISKDFQEAVSKGERDKRQLVLLRTPEKLKTYSRVVSEAYGSGSGKGMRDVSKEFLLEKPDMLTADDLGYAHVDEKGILHVTNLKGKELASNEVSKVIARREELYSPLAKIVAQDEAISKSINKVVAINKRLNLLTRIKEADQKGAFSKEVEVYSEELAADLDFLMKDSNAKDNLRIARENLESLKKSLYGTANNKYEEEIQVAIQSTAALEHLLENDNTKKLVEFFNDKSQFRADTFRNFIYYDFLPVAGQIAGGVLLGTVTSGLMSGVVFGTIARAAMIRTAANLSAQGVGGILGKEIVKESLYYHSAYFDEKVVKGKTSFNDRSLIGAYIEGTKVKGQVVTGGNLVKDYITEASMSSFGSGATQVVGRGVGITLGAGRSVLNKTAGNVATKLASEIKLPVIFSKAEKIVQVAAKTAEGGEKNSVVQELVKEFSEEGTEKLIGGGMALAGSELQRQFGIGIPGIDLQIPGVNSGSLLIGIKGSGKYRKAFDAQRASKEIKVETSRNGKYTYLNSIAEIQELYAQILTKECLEQGYLEAEAIRLALEESKHVLSFTDSKTGILYLPKISSEMSDEQKIILRSYQIHEVEHLKGGDELAAHLSQDQFLRRWGYQLNLNENVAKVVKIEGEEAQINIISYLDRAYGDQAKKQTSTRLAAARGVDSEYQKNINEVKRLLTTANHGEYSESNVYCARDFCKMTKLSEEDVQELAKKAMIFWLKQGNTYAAGNIIDCFKLPKAVVMSVEVQEAGKDGMIAQFEKAGNWYELGSSLYRDKVIKPKDAIANAVRIRDQLMLPKAIVLEAGKLGMICQFSKDGIDTAIEIRDQFKLSEGVLQEAAEVALIERLQDGTIMSYATESDNKLNFKLSEAVCKSAKMQEAAKAGIIQHLKAGDYYSAGQICFHFKASRELLQSAEVQEAAKAGMIVNFHKHSDGNYAISIYNLCKLSSTAVQ